MILASISQHVQAVTVWIFLAIIEKHRLQAATGMCPEPRPIANGRILTARHAYAVLDHVEYTCHPGYSVTGHLRLVCTKRGTWDYESPSCTLATCRPLLRNVEMYSPIKDIYHWGDVITVERCDEGFHLLTKNVFRCGFDVPLSCVGEPCPDDELHAVRNGRVVTKGRINIGTSVKVTCNHGFTLGLRSPHFRCGEETPLSCYRVQAPLPTQRGAAPSSGQRSWQALLCLALPMASMTISNVHL